MAVLDSKKAVSSLLSKGFERLNGDHIYLEYYNGKQLVLFTFVSHNGQDIGDHLIKQMSVQCKISKKDFKDLVNCPLSKEGYRKKLVEAGLITE